MPGCGPRYVVAFGHATLTSADVAVDGSRKLGELREQGDDRACCGRSHDELREQSGVAHVDAHVDVVERHVHRIAVGGLADEHPGRTDRQFVVPVVDGADAEQRGPLPAE